MLRSLAVVLSLLSPNTPTFGQSPAPVAKRDLHGDPLPDGAIGRFGTVRFRHRHAIDIIVPPGGRTFATQAWRTFKVFDVATGATLRAGKMPSGLDPKQMELAYGEDTVITPDGKHVIDFLPQGDTVRNLETGRVVQKLKAERRGTFQRLAHSFTPDGKILVLTGNHRGLIQFGEEPPPALLLYDLTTGAGKWLGHRHGPGRKVAIAPDGRCVFLYGETGVECWDVATNRKRPWASAGSARLLVSPKRTTVLTLSANNVLSLQKVEDGKPLPARLPRISGYVTALAWAPHGRAFAVSWGTRTLVWDVAKGMAVRTLPTGADVLAFTADGHALLTVRGVVQRWDLTTGAPCYSRSEEWGHATEVCHVLWSDDGKTLVTACGDTFYPMLRGEAQPCDSVFQWDVASRKPRTRYDGPVPDVRALGRGADNELVAVASDFGVYRWESATGKLTGRIELLRPTGHPHGTPQSVLHGRILPGGKDGLLYLNWASKGTHRTAPSGWDLQTGKLLTGVKAGPPAFTARGFPFAAWLLTGYGPERFNMLVNRPLPPLQLPGGYGLAEGFEFQEDADLLLLGIHDLNNPGFEGRAGGFGVWEAATGRLIKHVPFRWIFQHALSRDGRTAAFFSYGKLYVYDLAAERVVRTWEPNSWHGRPAFSPDGRLLATGLQDGTTLLWPVPEPTRSRIRPGRHELEQAWTELASEDAGRAWAAVWRLVDHPDAALALFKGRLHPARPVAPEQVARWVDLLDAKSFAVREQATRELSRLGGVVEPAVRKALARAGSEERRRRLEKAAAVYATIAPPRGEGLRGVRAVAVLQRIGGVEARRLLERLAAGDDCQYPTREARHGLTELRRREKAGL